MDGYKKLNNQPLIFALAEFRFSPIFEIEKYIPKIQEALRKKYPMVSQKISQKIQFLPDGMDIDNIPRWIFVSADKLNAVEISAERIVYTTKNYPRFDGFSEACRTILEMIAEVLEPALILRVGLRYGDAVIEKEGEKLEELVDSSFLLPDLLLGVERDVQRTTETIIPTKVGFLVVRSLCGNMKVLCMADINQGLFIPVKPELEPSKRVILDFDHFWEVKDPAASVAFNVVEIVGILASLHEPSREAFWNSTTDYARNVIWS